MIWLSQFLKGFDIGSKERTAIELKTLVRCLWLSGVYDQRNAQMSPEVYVNSSRLPRAERMGSRIGVLLRGSQVCIPAPTRCLCP